MRKYYRNTVLLLTIVNLAVFFFGLYYYGVKTRTSKQTFLQNQQIGTSISRNASIADYKVEASRINEVKALKLYVDVNSEVNQTKTLKVKGEEAKKEETENKEGENEKAETENAETVKVANKDAEKEETENKEAENEKAETAKVANKDAENEKAEEEEKELTILAVGDNLIHTQVIRSGKKSDGSYDFSHLFAGISKEVEAADLAIINQETILCDKSLGYSGYPRFGSPYEIGEAIHDAGFDVVLQATNHTMDKGLEGVLDTLQFWKQYDDITMVGINETEDALSRIGFYTKNGIKVAILNYTYGLNGLSVPKGKEYLINMLTDREQMKADIALAKKKSDFVIVCPHWGTEYVYQPTKQQNQLTQFFLEEGVDLVLGTHPHVLEPVEWLETKDGTHRMLVYYSLGNFVSNQDAMARMLGGMAKIKLIKKGEEVVIDEASIEPLVTHTYYDGRQRFTTYLLSEYDDKLAAKHYLNRHKKNTITLEKLTELSQSILGDWYQANSKSTILPLAIQSQ